MYAMVCSDAGRFRDSRCNFLQIGDATFSKNILQLFGKIACKNKGEMTVFEQEGLYGYEKWFDVDESYA